MAEAQTLVSEEEYLSTAWLQTAAASYFFARRREWDITVLTETRVQVKPGRLRVPDTCIVLGQNCDRLLTKPPFLCIEILSPEDRWTSVNARIKDFIAMGVSFVWLLDPRAKRTFIVTLAEGLREVKDGILRTQNPAFEVPLSEFFS